MTDRGLLFLTSLVMEVLSLAAAAWLVVSGQALNVDGLFLLMMVGAVALAFGLYLWFLYSRTKEELMPPPPGKKKAAPVEE